jgi:chloramphenicol O-acetyltransferase
MKGWECPCSFYTLMYSESKVLPVLYMFFQNDGKNCTKKTKKPIKDSLRNPAFYPGTKSFIK